MTTEADSGYGSFRQAVNDAMNNPGLDTIDVDRATVDIITLTTRHNPIGFAFYLQQLADLEIHGNGAKIVSGSPEFVLAIATNNVRFESLKFEDFTDYVIRTTIDVEFEDCLFKNCTGGAWGVIWQRGGDLVIADSEFRDCSGNITGVLYVDFLCNSTSLKDLVFDSNSSANNSGNAITIQYDAQITISGLCTFTGPQNQDILFLQGGGELPDPSNTATFTSFTLATGSVLVVND